jgi:hypothetical protein
MSTTVGARCSLPLRAGEAMLAQNVVANNPKSVKKWQP